MNPQKRIKNCWRGPRGVLAASIILLGGISYVATATQPSTPPNTEAAIQGLERSGQAFAAIAKKIQPAVVSLKIEKKVGNDVSLGSFGSGQNDDQSNPLNDEFFKRFFGDKLPEQFRQKQAPKGSHAPSQKHVVVGQGSGFIVSKDGYILTNNHVVGDASKVTVMLSDRREFQAKVIGSDQHSDVAVIKVEATNLPTIPWGDSTKTEVGEWVLASGAPYGLTQTLTAGIVSAIGRNSVGITSYENFIQTDAAINPGNSGGPLVNLRGEAIGMNTAIFSRNGGSVGLGFAIPIEMAKQVYDQILDHGSVVRGFLGVRIQGLTPEMAQHFGVKDSQGVVVGDVQHGAPGEKAGLKQADVIVELDGKKIEEPASFRNAIAMKSPGTTVHLTVVREGNRLDIPATLEKLPESVKASNAAEEAKPTNAWGLSVQPLTSDLAKKFGYKAESGLVISEVAPDSPASAAGLEPGTLILQVNRKPVRSKEEFDEAVQADQDSKTLLLLVSSSQGSRFVVLKTE